MWRVDNARVRTLELADLAHLLRAEIEIEHRKVRRKMIGIGRARDRNDVLLHKVAQRNLRRALAIGLADALERIVVRDLAARQGAIGGHRQAVLAAGGNDLGLVQERMHFDLVRHQRLTCHLHGFIEHRGSEIGDADMTRQPLALERAERRDALRERDLRAGPMDEQQVHRRKPERLEAVIESAFELVEAIPVDFGGQKYVVALHAGRPNAFADFTLIAIVLRRVDVAVANLQGRLDGFDADRALQRHGAKADRRNLCAIGFDDVHCILPDGSREGIGATWRLPKRARLTDQPVTATRAFCKRLLNVNYIRIIQ